MQVFIAGASGVLGRRLVAQSVNDGHNVIGLSRSEQSDERIRDAGGEPRRGDILDPDSLSSIVDQVDVIVHAATQIPRSDDPSQEAWEKNDRIRREGMKNLVALARATDADRVILQSIVWVARQPDGRAFDETGEPHPDRSTQSALDAERILRDGSEQHGFDAIILRGGYFYAHDAYHTKMFGKRLLAGRLPIIGRVLLGRDDATLSLLHVDDAAQAYIAAISGDETGIYHVVDDEPVRYGAFLRAFADRLGAKHPRHMPAWLATKFAGDEIVRLVSHSMPTSNDRFRDAFSWEPEYPTYTSGLDQVITQWEERGIVRPSDGGYAWTELK